MKRTYHGGQQRIAIDIHDAYQWRINPTIITSQILIVLNFAHLCSPLPIISLSGVDRHDCLSPCFSARCELWVELVLSQIAPDSVHPRQAWPSSRSLPSHLLRCYFLCNMCFSSSHYMAIHPCTTKCVSG